jgi:Suppressor of fused protein (SUFU)
MPARFPSQIVPGVLYQLANDVIDKHRAFLCGDIIERNNPIFAEKPFYAFWATSPSLLPDDFGSYTDINGTQIVFVWMVPITRDEAAFAKENGWTKLEDIFIAKDIDLVDLDRKSAV